MVAQRIFLLSLDKWKILHILVLINLFFFHIEIEEYITYGMNSMLWLIKYSDMINATYDSECHN